MKKEWKKVRGQNRDRGYNIIWRKALQKKQEKKINDST